FFEKIFDVVNLVGDEADDLLKSPVLLTRDLPVKNVVKQELRHHRGYHHVDLPPRQMHEHALQPPNLTRYVKLHAGGILIRRMGAMNRTAVILFAGDARREEAQKGLPARFLAKLHERLTRSIRAFDVDLFIADDVVRAPTLGEKIEQAFAKTFARGYERVIVLAGDIVLPPSILRRA